MKSVIAATVALFCIGYAGSASAQSYDYLVQRARPNLTGQQMTDILNTQAASGWDFYTGLAVDTVGDLIVVYRRPHLKCTTAPC